MPPKVAAVKKQTLTKSRRSIPNAPTEQDKNALSSMFKRIESNDSNLVKCTRCTAMVKSCLMKDHLETKCNNQMLTKLSDVQIKDELREIKNQKLVSSKSSDSQEVK